MTGRHRAERADIFLESWKGLGPLLNATRSVLATRQAQERAEQRDRHELERDGLGRDFERFQATRNGCVKGITTLRRDGGIARESRPG